MQALFCKSRLALSKAKDLNGEMVEGKKKRKFKYPSDRGQPNKVKLTELGFIIKKLNEI